MRHPSVRGVTHGAGRDRVPPGVARLNAPQAPAVHNYRVIHRFHTGWGIISGPSEQPETPPAREPEPPGEFVSEDLRADCTRFLEAIHALVGRRAEMLGPAKTGWVPNPPRVTLDEDVDTPPR